MSVTWVYVHFFRVPFNWYFPSVHKASFFGFILWFNSLSSFGTIFDVVRRLFRVHSFSEAVDVVRANSGDTNVRTTGMLISRFL